MIGTNISKILRYFHILADEDCDCGLHKEKLDSMSLWSVIKAAPEIVEMLNTAAANREFMWYSSALKSKGLLLVWKAFTSSMTGSLLLSAIALHIIKKLRSR